MLARGLSKPGTQSQQHARPSFCHHHRALPIVRPATRSTPSASERPARRIRTEASASFPLNDGQNTAPSDDGGQSRFSYWVARIRAIAFFTWSMTLAIPFFCFMLIIAPFVMVFDRFRRRGQHQVNKVWARLSCLPFNSIEIEGMENMPSDSVPAVYVSNHESYMDIFALFHLGKDFKFVSKTSIFLIPIVGWSMFLTGHMGLDRLDAAGFRSFIAAGKTLLKNGASLVVFPEGTRTLDGKMGEFKKGAFTIATMAKAVVVPITLIGTGDIMGPGREGELRPGKVKVIIHPPIPSKGTKTAALAEKARDVIASRLPAWKTS